MINRQAFLASVREFAHSFEPGKLAHTDRKKAAIIVGCLFARRVEDITLACIWGDWVTQQAYNWLDGFPFKLGDVSDYRSWKDPRKPFAAERVDLPPLGCPDAEWDIVSCAMSELFDACMGGHKKVKITKDGPIVVQNAKHLQEILEIVRPRRKRRTKHKPSARPVAAKGGGKLLRNKPKHDVQVARPRAAGRKNR